MQEKSTFFLPKTKLDGIQTEIDRIKKRELEKGRLRPQDAQHMQTLKGIKRRELFKQVGAVAVGVLALGGVGLGVRELTKKEHEPKNKLAGWTKSLIEQYNTWLERLNSEDVPRVNAVTEFMQIYNRSLPTIPLTEKPNLLSHTDVSINLAAIDMKLEPLAHALNDQGYFLMVTPITGEWKGAPLRFMGVLFGKKIVQETRETQKRGEKSEYDYIMIDKESPADPEGQYKAAPMDLSAIIYRTEDEIAVLQFRSVYREGAEKMYDLLHGRVPATTEGEMMNKLIFSQYKNMPEKEAISAIQNLYLEMSLHHEERHVLDNKRKEQQATRMNENQLGRSKIYELRGVISPITEGNPKVALAGVYKWKERSDRFGSNVGNNAAGILFDVSGKSLRQLVMLSDQELNVIGEQAMGATDILYDFVFRQGKKSEDPGVKNAYKNYIETLHLK